jgi:hypothetical protein
MFIFSSYSITCKNVSQWSTISRFMYLFSNNQLSNRTTLQVIFVILLYSSMCNCFMLQSVQPHFQFSATFIKVCQEIVTYLQCGWSDNFIVSVIISWSLSFNLERVWQDCYTDNLSVQIMNFFYMQFWITTSLVLQLLF